MRLFWGLSAVVALGVLGASLGAAEKAEGRNKLDNRVYELRIYHAAPGKMEALHERFRNHTLKLFKKHGMTVVAFWSPTDKDDAEKRLIYVLSFPSREAADRSWKAFREDPEWLEVKKASEKDGTLVSKVESTYMKPTDYAPRK